MVRCSKINALYLMVLSVFGLLTVSGCRSIPHRPPPAVIIVLLDAARADHFGTYGYPLPTTPEIDRIASESIVFERAYTAGGYTYPSVASLWTGLHVLRHGLIYNGPYLPPSAPTLPGILQQKHIRTASFISNWLVSKRQGFARGVDHYEPIIGAVRPPSPYKMLERARIWIQKQKRPYFAYIHLLQPHNPYAPPDDYVKKLGLPLPPRYLSQNDFVRKVNRGAIQPSQEEYQGAMVWYDANLRWADEAIGAFYRSLKTAGLLDNVWFVITADHGEAFGEHGEFSHLKNVYEETIHVPLIIRPPRWARKYVGRYQSYVYMQDLHPTVLEWFGVQVPDWVEFKTLTLAWKNPKYYGWREQVSCAVGYLMCSLRRREWKAVIHLAHEPAGLPMVELYQLPDEHWIRGNRAPVDWNRTEELYRLFRYWQLTGRFDFSREKEVEQDVQALKKQGFLEAWRYAETFYYAPTWLGVKDLSGEVEAIHWVWDVKEERPAVQIRIRNRGKKVWSALSLHGRGRIEVSLRSGEEEAPGHTGRDIHPGESGWFHLVYPVNWMGRGGVRGKLYLRQERGDEEVFLEEREWHVPGFLDVGSGWSREKDRQGEAFHWLEGEKGNLIAVFGERGTGCMVAGLTLIAYARPRRIEIRDRIRGDVVWKGKVNAKQRNRISWVIRRGQREGYRKYEVISLDGADRPLELMQSTDARRLSVQARQLTLEPCR